MDFFNVSLRELDVWEKLFKDLFSWNEWTSQILLREIIQFRFQLKNCSGSNPEQEFYPDVILVKPIFFAPSHPTCH